MNKATRARLEAAGFRETTVADLFGLTPEESELIETRLALSRLIKQLRQERNLTQQEVADQFRFDQSNLSKAERNESTVSLEWMVRVAYALGATRKRVGRAIGAS